jgi:acyl dehydratase
MDGRRRDSLPTRARGIACRAVVDTVLGGDVGRVAGYGARFAGVVLPGETLEISMWDEGDQVILTARGRERGDAVLSHSSIVVGRD